jgi:hypothetical protein
MWKSRRKPFWPSCALGRNDIETQQPPEVKSDWRQAALGIAISAACLGAIFWIVDPRTAWAELLAADLGWLSLSGVSVVLWLSARTVVWRELLQHKASARTVFFTLSEGYLLNNILPFRLGEVGRAFLLSRKSPVRFMEALTTILLERAFDVLFAASLVLAALPFIAGAQVSLASILAGGGAVLLGLAILYWMARDPDTILRLFRRVSGRAVRVQRLGERFLPPLLEGLAILKDARKFGRTVLLFLINLGIAVVQYDAAIRAFFPEATPLWAVFCLGVSSIGWALPSSPGGIGVFESAVVLALAAFNPDPAKAFACGFVLHLWNYLFTGVLGAYALTQDGESLIGLYRKIQRERRT